MWEQFLHVLLSAHQDAPYAIHNPLEEFEVALVGGNGPFPVPLIYVGAVIVIQEVVFADRAHVGAQPLSWLHVKALQGDTLPFGGCLHYLGVYRMDAAVIGNVELDGGSRTIAIQVIVDPAFCLDDQGNRDHHQVKLPAKLLLDIDFGGKNRLLRVLGIQQGMVVLRQDLLQLGIVPNTGTCEVGSLVG